MHNISPYRAQQQLPRHPGHYEIIPIRRDDDTHWSDNINTKKTLI